MPVERLEDKVILTHPKGATVEVIFYGATVVSWKCNGRERLFVSSKASLDGSKPIRGGVPLVFPCFGAPTHPDHSQLPQHGFARSERWSFDSIVMDNEAGASVRFTLKPTDSITTKYDNDFELGYVVTLAENQLTMDLSLCNPPQSPRTLEFQALFHNYFRVPASAVEVTPLQHCTYYDKTRINEEERSIPRIESRATVDVRTFTDFVFEDAPGNYEIVWPEGTISIKTTNLDNVVIWNPQEQGRKISDMEDHGWEHFICVEPGSVRGYTKLQPGGTWKGQQVLTVLDE